MNKKQALEFVKRSAATHFRYGDLSYLTSKRDALQDIQNIDDEAWGDGDIFEAHEYDNFLASSGVYEVTTSSDRDKDHTVTILAPSASEAEKVALGMDFGHGFPTDAVAVLVRNGLTEDDFDGQHDVLEEYVEKYLHSCNMPTFVVTEVGEANEGAPREIVAENAREALRIAANLSEDCSEYAIDCAAMRYRVEWPTE